MKKRLVWVVAAVGILLSVAQWRQGDRALSCSSDFLNFYTGARLAFSGEMYSPAAEKRVQHETLGCSGVEYYGQFVRMPYFAAALWPLAQLPFGTALVVWRWICVASVLVFVWVWPGPRAQTLAVCGWSFALMAAFVYGQDVPILLLAAGAAIALLGKGRDFEAGLCLAAGAAKPHLLVILVLLIVARRRWRALMGLGTGGAVVMAGCFAVGGPQWPWDFFRAVTGPAGTPNPSRLINLHGLASAFHIPAAIEAVSAMAFLVLIVWACLRAAGQMGYALALAGGVLLGFHSYLYDLAFGIPLMLTVFDSESVPRWLKWVTLAAASPLVFFVPTALPALGLVHFLLPTLLVAVCGAAIFRRNMNTVLAQSACTQFCSPEG